MKPIFRTLIIIFTALLSVSFIGCGGDDDEDDMKDDITIDFVDTTWQIVTINGFKFEQLFAAEASAEFESEFMLSGNSWTFATDGSFTGTLNFIVTEKYPDPVSSMTQEIDINSAGEYTVEGTTLTITKNELTIDVDVTLEPEEVWQQQLEGKTVEELEADMAAETKLGFELAASGALLTEGTEYSWSLKDDSLTLSTLTQVIVLERAEE